MPFLMRESRRKIKKQDLNTPAAPIRKRYSASPFVVQQPLAIARHPVSFSYALKALHSSDVEGIELAPFYTLCEELLQRFLHTPPQCKHVSRALQACN